MELLCLCLRRLRLTGLARVTTEKRLCTCSAPAVALTLVWNWVSFFFLFLYCYMQDSLTLETDKEGPIHDVSWSPNSKEFGVVYGYMPAKTTIFNFRGVAKHTFPLGPRNTILFSPYGRFVLVAGFGNLAGQMDIFNVEKDYAKITTVEAS